MEERESERMIYLNIQNYTGDKPVEVIVRKGTAEKLVDPLPLKAPIKTNVSGVITTPFDWLVKRIDTIDQKKAHVDVNRDKMTLTLIVNEDDEYTRGTITGKVEFTDVYVATRINTSGAWEPDKLGKFFRLNRILFSNREESMKLVSQLMNFTAKAKCEIQKQKDPSGSRAEIYKQEVQSNLPKDFIINLSIFKGTTKVAVTVEFDHYLSDGECYLQLVSPGANEAVEEFRDKCIDDVLDKIRAIAPDIAILEV